MKRILLIDDDEYEHMLVNFLLKDQYASAFSLGYASNVDDAKTYLKQNGVDYILLDDKLSDGTTSAETIPILQRQAFNVPIIIISKDTNGQHLKDRARLGMNRVVDKFKLKDELAKGLLESA